MRGQRQTGMSKELSKIEAEINGKRDRHGVTLEKTCLSLDGQGNEIQINNSGRL